MITELKNLPYIFIRHGKLDLPYRSHAHMPKEVLNLLGKKLLSPPIDREYLHKEIFPEFFNIFTAKNITRIITSPSRRSVETGLEIENYIKIKTGKSIVCAQNSDLTEVFFDLEHIRNNTTDTESIEDINSAVLRAMITGQGSENVGKVLKRVKSFFYGLNIVEGQTVVVAHDFIMRVIEIFLQNRGQNFDEIFDTKRNGYGEGFATNRSYNAFFPIAYQTIIHKQDLTINQF